MRYLVIIIAFISCSGLAMAQVVEHEVINRAGNNGTLTYIFQHEEIQGTQFLQDTWMDASITISNGYTFGHQSVKFDVYNNKIIFNRHDTAFELPAERATVVVYPNPADTSKKMVFKNGYSIDSKIAPVKFAQVLAEGNTGLLKYYYKEVEEYTEYGNANKLKRFMDRATYYVLSDKQYIPVTLGKKSLERILKPKWSQMEPYLRQHTISGKDEAGWVLALAYYNSLSMASGWQMTTQHSFLASQGVTLPTSPAK